MRQHTPHIQSDVRPMPYFPDVHEPSAGEPLDAEIDVDLVDLSDSRVPTPAFLLLDYRQRAPVPLGADMAGMDDAFKEADEVFVDEPSRARKVSTTLLFVLAFGGILALLGYEIMTLKNSFWAPLFNEFRRLSVLG